MADEKTPLENLRDFRSKIVGGYEPTDAEVKEALGWLRAHRLGSVTKSPKMAEAKAKLPTDLGELFK